MSEPKISPGLEGVVAGRTAVSTIEGGLRYRGYDVCELASRGTFEHTAFLLLHGELPDQRQLQAFRARLAEYAVLPERVSEWLPSLPWEAPPMDVLRSAASLLGIWDEDRDRSDAEALRRKSERLVAQLPVALATFWRGRAGERIPRWSAAHSFSANVLHALRGAWPTDAAARALDITLVLYAEHEFNASTFTARIVASTLSDLHSAITAAIGALKGPLHGGANERVVDMLLEIGSPDRAESWLRRALREKRRVMGFGHRVYKHGDPRAEFLRDHCRQLASEVHAEHLEEIAATMERILLEEKGLRPNLDWPSARLYYYLGLEVPLYTPLFVLSRVAGWCAHVIEQQADNRLIRPRAEYVGPPPRNM